MTYCMVVLITTSYPTPREISVHYLPFFLPPSLRTWMVWRGVGVRPCPILRSLSSLFFVGTVGPSAADQELDTRFRHPRRFTSLGPSLKGSDRTKDLSDLHEQDFTVDTGLDTVSNCITTRCKAGPQREDSDSKNGANKDSGSLNFNRINIKKLTRFNSSLKQFLPGYVG